MTLSRLPIRRWDGDTCSCGKNTRYRDGNQREGELRIVVDLTRGKYG
jgi:hypothetical protein